jgi:hypothetical protein
MEVLTYGSELEASSVEKELTYATKYMRWPLGVTLDGPTSMLGENMTIVRNASVPQVP